MRYPLMCAQCVNVLVILLANFTPARHCVDVCVDNVPLAMLLVCSKHFPTQTTSETQPFWIINYVFNYTCTKLLLEQVK